MEALVDRETHCTFTLRRKIGRLFIDLFNGKSEQNRMRDHLARISSELELCKRNVRSRFRLHSRTGNWWLNRQRRWNCFFFCSAAILDVYYDFIFTALELSALKPWLVRLANADCTVIDCGSQVKRVFDQERWY